MYSEYKKKKVSHFWEHISACYLCAKLTELNFSKLFIYESETTIGCYVSFSGL